MLMLSLTLLVALMTNTARAVAAGGAQSGLGISTVSGIFNAYGSPSETRGGSALAGWRLPGSLSHVLSHPAG